MKREYSEIIRIAVSVAVWAIWWIVTAFVAMPTWCVPIGFVLAYLIVGADVLWRACVNIAHREVLDETFLMTVATIGAFAIGEYHEAVAVMVFYQIGECFQQHAVRRTRKQIRSLLQIRPDTARILVDGQEQIVAPEQVQVGQTVVIRAGERVAVDGVALTEGVLDTSALTGESLPRNVAVGDRVLSGCINTAGTLEIRAERAYADSTVAKILDMVQNAADKKAKSETFITRFARYYTPIVVIGALLLAVLPPLIQGGGWSDWIHRALSFLVVSCPCALVISVPMSFFCGIGGASSVGVLVKGGTSLESLRKVNVFAFDKTGTVTQGKLQVAEIRSDIADEQVLACASMAERHSNHPMARAICLAAQERGVYPSDDMMHGSVREIAGKGAVYTDADTTIAAGSAKLLASMSVAIPVSDTDASVVHVAKDGKWIGAIYLQDTVRSDAAETIARLHADRCKTVMLTGDTPQSAMRVANAVGIDWVEAGLLPDEKVAKLESLMGPDTCVGYVGDGINDAPVLTRADVGIAMGKGGSDVAIESADVVLMHDSLQSLTTARAVARKTTRIVRQNIVLTLAVKAIVLILSAVGLGNLWLAVVADVGVAVLAILNAMRCLRVPKIGKAD